MMKKGFTLLELLAVIVILGIIGLIAVPTVLSAVANAREGAMKSSAYGYIYALEEYVAKEFLFNETPLPTTFETPRISEVEVKGDYPTEVSLTLYEGTVVGGEIAFGDYNFAVGFDGELTLSNPEEGTPFGYQIPSGCASWTLITWGDNITSCLHENTLYLSGTGPMYDFLVDETYEDLGSIAGIVVMPGITTIGDYAFYYSYVEDIAIAGTVTSIGDYAIYYASLYTAVFSEGLQSIGEYAFAWNMLTDVTIPDSVDTIANRVFFRNDIATLDLGTGVQTIGDYAFATNDIVTLVIPDSTTAIGYESFYGNNLISSVDLGDGLITIGTRSFADSNSLTSVTFGNSIQTIGYEAFKDARLTTLVLPNTIQTIDSYAFHYNNLTSIDIGSGITTIGSYAFSYNYIPQGSAIIRTNSGNVTIDATAFQNNGAGRDTTITPTFNP
jgi:prepilin-type N-terminal cleavage/methylation domain-containing protein